VSDPPIPIRSFGAVGPTPVFDSAHLLLDATLPWPRDAWPLLLERSVRVARQLAAAVPHGEALLRAADTIAGSRHPGDPWSRWVAGLADAHDVPSWNADVSVDQEGLVGMRLTCRYRPVVGRWARFAMDILQVAEKLVSDRKVEVPHALWARRVAALGDGLPTPGLMLFHDALRVRGLPWDSPSPDRTRIGWGSRQTLVRGTPPDPAGLAASLAAKDLVIPVYAVTGSVGKTTTSRLLAQILASTGLRIGAALSDGVWAGDRRLRDTESTGGRIIQTLVRQDDIDAAVCEIARGGLIKFGMPLQRVDIAMLLNVDAVHMGANGVATIEQMAEVKALVLEPARLVVLNRDDAQCRRLAERMDAKQCIWFSLTAKAAALRTLSRGAGGALGVVRGVGGDPAALEIWHDGEALRRLSLEGVAPFHGMLGEKTVEELLAAVAAAWFGPVEIEDWDGVLRRLRLDDDNHAFRASLHKHDDVLFMLDKAGEEASQKYLEEVIASVCAREQIAHRILVFTRSAGLGDRDMQLSCAGFHPLMDEFICFENASTYHSGYQRPDLDPGSIPKMLGEIFAKLNRAGKVEKPIWRAADWAEAEALLRDLLAKRRGKTLVLINQPSTAESELNKHILGLVTRPFESGLLLKSGVEATA